MVRIVIRLVAFLIATGILFALSCEKTKPLGGREIALVNDRVITVEEFEQEMEQLPPSLKTLIITEKGRRDFLQGLIDRELLLQEGIKKGLDRDEKLLKKVKRFKEGLIIEAMTERLCAGKDEVKDEEVESYYRENKSKFTLGERVRVRHIMVKTLAEAQQVKERLKQGEDFITLARELSIWPTREKGGDLGYIQRGMVDRAFEQAAFSLRRRGELSDIVKTRLGYHIIRLEDRQMPRELSLAEVQNDIRDYLREKKRKEILTTYLQDLRRKAKVLINEERLGAERAGS